MVDPAPSAAALQPRTVTVGAKERRNLAIGLAFLGPNILGFCTFTLIPLVFSLVLAFSNWDLKLHNRFKQEHIHFLGLANFARLLRSDDFTRYLGNTLFLMMGIPFAIAASLVSASLLSKDLRGGTKRTWAGLFASAILIASTLLIAATAGAASAMTFTLLSLIGGVLVLGVAGGNTIYRTLFYIPNFTSGVATFILWKKLYAPANGPINNVLFGPLASLGSAIKHAPTFVSSLMWVCLAGLVTIAALGLRRMRRSWSDGDTGPASLIAPIVFLILPALLGFAWLPTAAARVSIAIAVGLALLYQSTFFFKPRPFGSRSWEGTGTSLMYAAALMVAQFVLLGLAIVLHNLPGIAAKSPGLQPPQWLSDYYWAKPALMIMGFWGAIGSDNMLLYIAALTNVPAEMYEAAEIDGASRFQKFWNVTWPQLAPTTFFIVVMSIIRGLQGGFEVARVMTNGGPAGSTTSLSYYIYTEGFETGRLGYSSAVAWVLFLMVLLITAFNWKFGNKYVND